MMQPVTCHAKIVAQAASLSSDCKGQEKQLTVATSRLTETCTVTTCDTADNLDSVSVAESYHGQTGAKEASTSSSAGRPHFAKAATLLSAVTLSKAAIGSGTLELSTNCAQVGMASFFCGLMAAVVLTMLSSRLIVKVSIATGCWSFEDISDELLHPAMSHVTGFINFIACLGGGVGSIIISGQVFQVITNSSDATRRDFAIMLGTFICAPLALAKEVSCLRHLAACSHAALVLLIAVVVWLMLQNGLDESIEPEALMWGNGDVSIFSYMNAMGIIVFSFSVQSNLPQITGELTPEPTTGKMMEVCFISTMICFLVYASVTVVAILAFGVERDTGGSLVMDLGPAGGQWQVRLALVGILLGCIVSFQFTIYPMRQYCAYVVRRLRGRSANDEAADAIYCGRSLTRWLDLLSALLSVGLCILVAVAIPSLHVVLAFVGSFCDAYICYIVPPVWMLRLLRRQQGFTWCGTEVLACLALFTFGIVQLVFGTLSVFEDR
eukprot:CAMPEP_0195157042 /NCGR_PEP_ID=MMETSP0448-20130528/184963_1 /TAXON_ID=66468 /ORGANISM="Heterocapsa triquestra, Strain CCMP 448" /LENGTH=494 /DNA_ID=CAMNT_0040195833 /DNA_START=62 /DNA_END=1546 /DNA_ORIENTATION=+